LGVLRAFLIAARVLRRTEIEQAPDIIAVERDDAIELLDRGGEVVQPAISESELVNSDDPIAAQTERDIQRCHGRLEIAERVVRRTEIQVRRIELWIFLDSYLERVAALLKLRGRLGILLVLLVDLRRVVICPAQVRIVAGTRTY